MTTKRNYNVDIIRCASLFIMLIYHCWVKIGFPNISNSIVATFVSLGGEIGVTGFFVLSGYGIWCSLHRLDQSNQLSFGYFVKKRVNRIAPQYYLCLIVTLLFTSSAVYLSKEHIVNILAHFLFIHNVSINYSGAINGVLWTMAIIFQFYLFAILLYKGLKKYKEWLGLATIIFTILAKALSYFLLDKIVGEDFATYSFWIGRQQLFTTLDNFVIGMAVAKIIEEKKLHFSSIVYKIGIVIAIVLLYVVCRMGLQHGIHTNNLSGYTWHSLLAVVIGLMVLCVGSLNAVQNKFINKIIVGCSNCEYGIYLWYLVVIDNLILSAPIVRNAISRGYVWLTCILFLIVSVGVGYIFTKLTDNLKIFRE